MSLPNVIYRLTTDMQFRAEMKADPRAALAAAGTSLSDEELHALQQVPWDVLALPTRYITRADALWWICQLSHGQA